MGKFSDTHKYNALLQKRERERDFFNQSGATFHFVEHGDIK